VDETILSLLQERGVLASADLASGLGIHERSVRRHLRRLIRAGYVPVWACAGLAYERVHDALTR